MIFLIQSLDSSGAPKSLSLIANHIVSIGHEVTIFAENSSIGIILDPRIQFIFSPMGLRDKVIGRLRLLIFLRNYLKKNSFDIAITFVPLYIFACTSIQNLRLIYSDRGEDTSRMQFKFYRNLAKFADYIVVQTPYAIEHYRHIDINKFVVIPNAIQNLEFDEKLLLNRSIKAGKISCSGRLHIQQKRQDVLISAIQLVHHKLPNVCLYIYGDGPDKSVLEQMIIDQNAGDYVKLEGFSNDIARDLFDSEIFVLSSDYEGLPNSLIEAMQLGLPCIATDCLPGGAKYLLEQGSGMIVERDNPILLAQGICKLLHNTSLQIQFSEKGIERVKEFSEKNIMYKWDMLLETVISAKQSL